jgi:hypothetical protein
MLSVVLMDAMAMRDILTLDVQCFSLVQNVAEMQNQVADLEVEVEVYQALAH